MIVACQLSLHISVPQNFQVLGNKNWDPTWVNVCDFFEDNAKTANDGPIEL